MTTDDWDPSTPLSWDDLESEPFVVHDRPEAENGVHEITADLPDKSGRHLIYTVWQRTDSPEAFYSCSDVVFGGGSESADGTGDDRDEQAGGTLPETGSAVTGLFAAALALMAAGTGGLHPTGRRKGAEQV